MGSALVLVPMAIPDLCAGRFLACSHKNAVAQMFGDFELSQNKLSVLNIERICRMKFDNLKTVSTNSLDCRKWSVLILSHLGVDRIS